MEKDKVLLTGVTGYLGSHVGQQFLKNCPNFTLKCSMRNVKKAEVFRDTFGEEAYNSIEWVQADLDNPEQIMKAVEGCKYVIHVASPIPGANAPKNNDFMIKVAEDGMKYVLDACEHHKVEKLIVTGSVACVSGAAWGGNANPNYSEKDFAIEHKQPWDGYIASKIM